MKSFFYFILLFPIITFSQIKEEIRNEKGNLISVIDTKANDLQNRNSEAIINLFYENLNKINVLDNLLSFRFYQTTPYVKFKEIMETKNNLVGSYKSKKIIDVRDSEKSNIVIYKYEVEYTKKTTIEEIALIQEDGKEYQILSYNIKEN